MPLFIRQPPPTVIPPVSTEQRDIGDGLTQHISITAVLKKVAEAISFSTSVLTDTPVDYRFCSLPAPAHVLPLSATAGQYRLG
jgi:hypothetical protein